MILLVITHTNDRQFFVNVLNHSNVVEYFLPYFVISLLDVILKYIEIMIDWEVID